MGFYSGIFFAIFQASGIIGNVLTGTLLKVGLPQWLVWIILASMGAAGNAILLFIRKVDKNEVTKTGSQEALINESVEKKNWKDFLVVKI